MLVVNHTLWVFKCKSNSDGPIDIFNAHRSGPHGQCARAASQCAAATGQCARAQRSAQQPYSGVRQPPNPRLRRAQPSAPQSPAQCAGACRPVRNDKRRASAARRSAHRPAATAQRLGQCARAFWLSAPARMWVPVQSAGPPAHCASAPGPYRSAPGPRRSAPGPSGPCRAHSPLAGLISAPEITTKQH